MNIVDLRKQGFEYDEILVSNDEYFIFVNTTKDTNNRCKKYFYKYDIKSNIASKINYEGIDTCQWYVWENYILGDNIYFNVYEEYDENTKIVIYRMNYLSGVIQKLYSKNKEENVTFLNERYVLFMGDNSYIDDENFDVKKQLAGEYNYAILCDLQEKKEYNINDKRVILGIRDYFIPYTIDKNDYIVFEEAYMEDWELEEEFENGVKKEEFYNEAYKESINIILLDDFVKAVKNHSETIPFKIIYETQLSAWTRYFGMDKENIYFRVKDFNSKIQNIYKVNKKNLDRSLLKSIDMKNIIYSCETSIWNHIENKKIYVTKDVEKEKKVVFELMDKFSFQFNCKANNESISGIIEDKVITSFWTEDENGDNYKEFTRVISLDNNNDVIYEGISTIIKDNLILFK